MLKVIERARRSLPVDISSTYCAHAIPKGQTASEATNDVLHKHLPRLRELMTSGDLKLHNVDVFCEQGVFDVTQSHDILLAGEAMGLNINFHGEELHLLHSAEMGAEIGALTISHLEEVCQDGVKAMARSGHTSALLLPTTAYTLRLPPPPARSLI
ncbi:putative imidazolonepropionase [Nucella lapillus]